MSPSDLASNSLLNISIKGRLTSSVFEEAISDPLLPRVALR